MPDNKILEVRGLNKWFGGQQVTKDLNFHLYEGDQAAIIGPNGAGKTTFFNLLTGRHRADSGSVLFDGRELTHLPSYLIARAGMTRAFQVSNIFPKLTALENVRSAVQAQTGRALDLFSRAERIGAAEAEEILRLCRLEKEQSTLAGELSQGDKKKLELALALAGRPKLLLLDEPTAGMSPEETRETMALIDHLNQALRLTVLFTEHDMGVVFNHARRVTLLHRGEKIVEGSPQEVRRNETAQRIYLGEQQ